MKLSVALCSYNGANYIEQQVLSILYQDLPVQEIIICDDNSKDETLQIINNIAEKYNNIEWNIHKNSRTLGVVKNFEKAITLCTGDFIFLSDQDDVWRRDKTAIIVDYFNNNPQKNVVFTDATLIDSDGNILSDHSLLDAVRLSPNLDFWLSGLDFEILNLGNRATGATMAFRRSFSKAFLPFANDKDHLHDGQIAMKACLLGCLGLIQDRLISYRQHDKNVVGVKPNNWIYNNKSPYISIQMLVEPRPLPGYLNRFENKRIAFYKKRINNYSTVCGKLYLLSNFFNYKRYYKKFWITFLISDFLYGVNKNIRTLFLNRIDLKELQNKQST